MFYNISGEQYRHDESTLVYCTKSINFVTYLQYGIMLIERLNVFLYFANAIS